jgi:DNA repair protein RadA/Sms
MIIAVLERKAGVSLINRDVYVNVVGGLKPEGTGTDLAAAVAIWSDERGVKIPPDTLIIGEIGLTGDLRPVQSADKLIKEASRMGFKRAILPQRNLERASRSAAGMELTGVRTLAEALTASSQISQK